MPLKLTENEKRVISQSCLPGSSFNYFSIEENAKPSSPKARGVKRKLFLCENDTEFEGLPQMNTPPLPFSDPYWSDIIAIPSSSTEVSPLSHSSFTQAFSNLHSPFLGRSSMVPGSSLSPDLFEHMERSPEVYCLMPLSRI